MSIEKESCMPCRDKYWSELGIEEKIERMRGVVNSQQERLESLQESFYRLQTFVEKHSHDNDGKLLIRVDGNELRQTNDFSLTSYDRKMVIGKPENKDEVYF